MVWYTYIDIFVSVGNLENYLPSDNLAKSSISGWTGCYETKSRYNSYCWRFYHLFSCNFCSQYCNALHCMYCSPYCTVLYCTVLLAVQYALFTVLHCTVLVTVLHCTVQGTVGTVHCTVQCTVHCTALIMVLYWTALICSVLNSTLTSTYCKWDSFNQSNRVSWLG